MAAADELVTMFRTARLPVVRVRQEFEPDLSDAFPEMRAGNVAVTTATDATASYDARHARVTLAYLRHRIATLRSNCELRGG